ncbi:unnamed protein product [Closterium sp. Naga37s-1]|nr:unnamed protein product [Closterium sp. Naga37s-1]
MPEDVYRSGAFLLPCFNPRARFYNWDGTDPRYGGESQPIGANHPAGHGQGDEEPVALGEPVDALIEAETQIYTGSPDLGTETPATEEDLSSLRPANDKTTSEFRGGRIAAHENDPHPSRPTNRLTGVATGRVNPCVVGEKQEVGGTRVDGQYRPVEKSPKPVATDNAVPKVVASSANDEDIGKKKDVVRGDVFEPTSPLAASLPVPTGPNRNHDPVTGATLGVGGGMLSDTRDEQAEQKGGAASMAGLGHGDVIDRNATKLKDEDNGQAEPGVTPRAASLGHDGHPHSGAMAAAARLPNFETAISFIDVVERLLPIPSTIRLATEGTNDAREAAIMGVPIRARARVDALARAGNGDPSEVDMWHSYRDLERFEEEYLSYGDEWEIRVLELQEGLGAVTFRLRPLVCVSFAAQSDATHLTFNGRQLAHPMMFSLDNIPEASRWLEGGVEMVALFPPLPAALTPEQKTELMHEMLRLVLGPLMRASSVESQCEAVMAVTPPSLLRHPDPSAYFGTVSQYAAWEHRAMMQIVPLVAHLPGHEDIARVVILFNEWYRAYFRVAYHTEASLQDATRKTLVPLPPMPLAATGSHTTAADAPASNALSSPAVDFHASDSLAAHSHAPAPARISCPSLRCSAQLRPCSICSSQLMHMPLMPLPCIAIPLTRCCTMLRRLVAELKLVFPKQSSQWRLPKVHLLRHLPHAIRMHGIPSEQSTNTYEAMHKRCCKWPARNSNWRDVGRDIAVRHARNEAIRGLGREEGGRTYETAMRTAVNHNTRVLTRRSRRMAVGDAQDPVWAEYGAALGSVVMDGIAWVMQRVGIAASGVQVMPRHMVKAAPGEGKFSYVSIDGGEGEWYARCLMLFHFMDDEAQIHRRAVVRYFDEHPTPCPVTGCVRLLPTEGEDEYAVVEVESILSLAHIVPCFTEPRFSLVNRFLFDE